MLNDITKRLAHRIWEVFEKEEIPNNAESNYSAAEGIIKRIVNGSYNIDEFRSMLSEGDFEYLKREADNVREIARLDSCSGDG